MDDEDKLTVFNNLENVRFYDNIQKKRLKSARLKDALFNLPQAVAKFHNHSSPATEIVEDASDNLQGEGV